MTETASLRIEGHDGDLEIAVGQTILEVATACEVHLDHACGGVCACSTCHVKITTGGDCFSEASEGEEDQLDEARDVDLTSRLGCQARLQRVPEGGIAEIRIPTWNVNLVQEG